jgi:hypothetical protein
MSTRITRSRGLVQQTLIHAHKADPTVSDEVETNTSEDDGLGCSKKAAKEAKSSKAKVTLPVPLCRTLHSFWSLVHPSPSTFTLSTLSAIRSLVRSRLLVLVFVLLLAHSHIPIPRISTLTPSQSSPASLSPLHHDDQPPSSLTLAAPSSLHHPRCTVLAAPSLLHHPRCTVLAAPSSLAPSSLHRPRSVFSSSHLILLALCGLS